MPNSLRINLQAFFASERFIWGVVIVGIVLRLIWALLVHPEPTSDSAVYVDRALSIANGHGYSMPDGTATAYWPVGYSAFLAAFLCILNDPHLAVIVSNVVLASLLMYLFYRLVGIVFEQREAVSLAVLVLAFYPDNIAYASLATSEVLGSVLLIAYLLLVLGKNRLSSIIFSGIVIGLATLTKAQSILFPVLVFVLQFWLAGTGGERFRAFRTLILTVLVAVLVVTPWGLRNYHHFDRFVLSTNGGINLFIGNNEHSTGRYIYTAEDSALFAGLGEVERDEKAKKMALEYIASEPITFLSRIPLKIFYLFRTDGDGFSWNEAGFEQFWISSKGWRNLKIIATLYYYVILVFGMLGAVYFLRKLLLRHGGKMAVFSVIVFYYIAICGIFFGVPRFHDIFMPFLIILGVEFFRVISSRFYPGSATLS